MRIRRTMMAAALLAAAAAGCGSSANTSGGSGHGKVSVLYAGSLTNLMEHDLGPAFSKADGYQFEGVGAGSTELVTQIKGKVKVGDVFISAAPKANAGLEGAANGNFVSWFTAFAKAPLVIGYNAQSRFASQFRSKPWYQVITEPGIRVGRTDPMLDPKGKLTVTAVDQASTMLAQPALAKALPSFAVFPEETLVGRLQAGQLDAGFFYSNEATEQHIPTSPLSPVAASATYTITELKGAPDDPGAQAFIAFLLGPTGKATLTRHGLTVTAPTFSGTASAVPAGLHSVTGAG